MWNLNRTWDIFCSIQSIAEPVQLTLLDMRLTLVRWCEMPRRNFAIACQPLWTTSSKSTYMIQNRRKSKGQDLYSLIGRIPFRKISWSLGLVFFNRSRVRQLPRQQCPRVVRQFLDRHDHYHPLSQHRDITRFGGNTSFRLVNRSLAVGLVLGHMEVKWWPNKGHVLYTRFKGLISQWMLLHLVCRSDNDNNNINNDDNDWDNDKIMIQ